MPDNKHQNKSGRLISIIIGLVIVAIPIWLIVDVPVGPGTPVEGYITYCFVSLNRFTSGNIYCTASLPDGTAIRNLPFYSMQAEGTPVLFYRYKTKLSGAYYYKRGH
jgi:hypothetical protein